MRLYFTINHNYSTGKQHANIYNPKISSSCVIHEMQAYNSGDQDAQAKKSHPVLAEERLALLLRTFCSSVPSAALRAPLLALLEELGLPAAQL